MDFTLHVQNQETGEKSSIACNSEETMCQLFRKVADTLGLQVGRFRMTESGVPLPAGDDLKVSDTHLKDGSVVMAEFLTVDMATMELEKHYGESCRSNPTYYWKEAASKGNLELVQLFLALNIPLHQWSDEGTGVMQAAAANGHLEIVKVLLDAGVDIDSTAREGFDYYAPCAVVQAARNGHLDVVRYLADKKAWGLGEAYLSAGNDEVEQFLQTRTPPATIESAREARRLRALSYY